MATSDFMAMRALWSSRRCASAEDVPPSLNNVRWVGEDTVEYHSKDGPVQARTLRGVLNHELAENLALARELFDHIVGREESVFVWDVRGPRIFKQLVGR